MGIGRSIAWRRSHWVVVPDVVSMSGVAMRLTRAEARRWFGVRPHGLALSVAMGSRGVIQGSHELVSVTINIVVRVDVIGSLVVGARGGWVVESC